MKFHGIKEEELSKGVTRPIFYLFDNSNFALISFMISEDSPYTSRDGKILYYNKELPFQTIQAMRLTFKLPYYYFRGPISPFHPTLDNENILNTNFNPKCSGCDFCFYGYRQKHLVNISAKAGLELVLKETDMKDFTILDEIAYVTGRFPSDEKLKEQLLELIHFAHENGFSGRLFYIGSQLTSPLVISEIIDALGNPKLLKLSYTAERFFDRQLVMHTTKGKKDLSQILEDINNIKLTGITELQYSYLVGIENLEEFRIGAKLFVPYATPHISIFRKTGLESNYLSMSKDYLRMGSAFTCEIRKHFEELYGRKIVGNNFANLWTFPLHRLDLTSYLTKVEKTGGHSVQ